MALSYDIGLRLDPENPIPGGWVDVVAELTNVTGEVRNVKASIVGYDYYLTLQPSGENRFSARAFVPWEADPGEYQVSVWGVSPSGESGPRSQISVSVKPR
ncbi:MAG: hypothetical protein ACOYEP_08975 [Limnochordia bacterium]|jgi:hypothetical protein